VTNIGYGEDAVHCTEEVEGISNVPTFPILPLTYPTVIEQNKAADNYFSCKYDYRISIRKVWKTFIKRLHHD
jgi:hypothetical protein